MKSQVLIVGAGPVGLTLAVELARFGVVVRIIDKASGPTDKSKALVVWSRTLELLERAGCSRAFLAAGFPVVAANIIAGNKLIGHVNLAGVQSPYPFALMLPQSETERLLTARLSELGVTVERQAELVSFEETQGGLNAMVRHADGSDETLSCDWLVGCDGAHSTVRHTLGLAFEGDTLQSDWMLADVHLAGVPVPPNELVTYWHQDGVLVLFPIAPGRYRAVADLGASDGALPATVSLSEVQTILDQRGPGGIVASDPVWLTAFRINERKVKDYRQGRVFVAGDAAHVHSPAGGQGMNTGMQDAFNLAWKLALVCQGTCAAEPLLQSYSIERSAVGDDVLKSAGRLTSVAVMKNHTAQSIRNFLGSVAFGLAPVRETLANSLTEISVGYPHSPLNGAGGHVHGWPAAGSRLEPFFGDTPIGSAERPRFALLAAHGPESARLLQEYAELLEPAERPLPDGTAGLGLVRPDGYMALVAPEGGAGVIADYLDALRSPRQ